MQFLYWLPGIAKASVSTTELDALGLSHMHDGRQPQCTQNVTLGEHGRGLLLTAADDACPADTPPDLRYVPDAQVWRPGPREGGKPDGRPRYFVGHAKDRPPNPDALLRTKPVGGVPVPLRGGGEWLVPVAMARFGNATLPKVLSFDDDVQGWRGRVAAEYDALCAHARQAYDWLWAVFAGEPSTLRYDEALPLVTAALAVNYRVGPIELSMLACVGSDETWAVLKALADWPAFLALYDEQAKKNPPASE